MPWFVRPLEYNCDGCKKRFLNRPSLPGLPSQSTATISGATQNETWCEACAATKNRHFLSPIKNQTTSLGTTITYRIHKGKNFTFLGSPTEMSKITDTAAAMTALGALNLMEHPAYPGGKIRPPGGFSGPNLKHDALAAWPGAPGMMRHHVHVGAGGQQRVLFGWTANPYPNNAQWVQAVTLYIGS